MLDTKTDTSLDHFDQYRATLQFPLEPSDMNSEELQVARAGVALNNAFPDVQILETATGKTLDSPASQPSVVV